MPFKLRRLKIKKVSAVPLGAGKGVTVELWKRRKENSEVSETKARSVDEILASLPEDDANTMRTALEVAATAGFTP